MPSSEDGYVARGYVSEWLSDESTASWGIFPPTPLPLVKQSLPRFLASRGRIEDIIETSGPRCVSTCAVSTRVVDEDESVTNFLSPLRPVSEVGSTAAEFR